MITIKSFAIIGGDLRQVQLANSLANDGAKVFTFGFPPEMEFSQKIKIASAIDEVLSDVDFVLLPLPCSIDDETVNLGNFDGEIYLNELFSKISSKTIVLGGRLSAKVKSMASALGIYAIDYFEREELTVLNAIPTAEGAIQIAMEETLITLCGSNCLILGFGRIGKVLCKMLHGIGAKVTACARKAHDLAWIKSLGYKSTCLSELSTTIDQYDIIINTIPSVLLDKSLLPNVRSETLIIDLASKPGGVDFEAARQLGVKVIWALSLPGKVAPITSGEIIKQTVVNIINELGV